MTTFSRLARQAVGWGVLVGLVGGAAVVGVRGLSEHMPPAAGEDEGPSGDELEAERAAMLSRIEAKRQAVEDVLAGRLAPGEAAERFRTFKAELRRRYLPWEEPTPRNAFEEERLCQEVLAYARDALRDRPAGAEDALIGLEQELREHLALRGLTSEGGAEGGPEMPATRPGPTRLGRLPPDPCRHNPPSAPFQPR
jgi:hypothetical protein